jgi:YidC/Oxa1 family membrane protein insertase
LLEGRFVMTAVFGVPVDAAYHLVLALTNFLSPVLGGLAAVAAIIVFTMAIRLLLTPLSFRALRGQAAMTRLAPQIQELRKRYGRQPERLQRELTALYSREGTSLLSGFVPLLAQWPVFSVLYLLFRSPTVAGGPNSLLSHGLFGVPLGAHWLGGGAATAGLDAAVFPVVLAILAVICWLSIRVARRMTAALAETAVAIPAGRAAVGGSAKAKPAPAASDASAAVAWLGKVLPYITVVIAAFAPLAAAVYLVVSVSWSVGERRVFAARSRRRSPADEVTSGDKPRVANTLGDRAQRS